MMLPRAAEIDRMTGEQIVSQLRQAVRHELRAAQAEVAAYADRCRRSGRDREADGADVSMALLEARIRACLEDA